jgi:hypothetical protein
MFYDFQKSNNPKIEIPDSICPIRNIRSEVLGHFQEIMFLLSTCIFCVSLKERDTKGYRSHQGY